MGALGEYVVDLAAHHVLDEHAFGHLALVGVEGDHGLPVAQDGDLVGDPDDLLQLVRDQDAGDAVLLQIPDDGEQVLAVVLVEGRRGLIQDEQLHVAAEGLGDLHQLLLAHAQVLDLGLGVQVQADLRSISLARLIVSFQSTLMPCRISWPRRMFS